MWKLNRKICVMLQHSVGIHGIIVIHNIHRYSLFIKMKNIVILSYSNLLQITNQSHFYYFLKRFQWIKSMSSSQKTNQIWHHAKNNKTSKRRKRINSKVVKRKEINKQNTTNLSLIRKIERLEENCRNLAKQSFCKVRTVGT